MKYKVLSTKKLEPSILEYAKQNDIDIIEQEFISVKPILSHKIQNQIIELVKSGLLNIVFTSSNAVTTFENYLHVGDTFYLFDWEIFCLSGKTKEVVLNSRRLGKNIVGEAENASNLAKKIIDQKIPEVIFPCGNKRREELPSLLKNAGIKVHEIMVYETIETPTTANDTIDAILFFSPSAVQSFFSVNHLKKSTVCFAIGKTTAESIADFTGNKIITSESPSQEMMIASVQNYFQNINCYE
ncbi:MAG TPA: uroporphyrinogen-III synthase [Chitinophagaceae bacterium]|jgi:uroporphyrinogen-III synthase|nr:uroporphyrinogen-III synthase [Chitinophagaceae bacterium]